MKKMIHFSKAFLPCAIISSLVIISGVVGVFVRGINFGIDFKPGLIEEVRIAPSVMDITYSGTAKATIDITSNQTDIVISGTGAENETKIFKYTDYATVNDLAAALKGVENIAVTVKAHGDAPSASLFVNSAASNQLAADPYTVYASGLMTTETDQVRSALVSLKGVAVKQLGSGADISYQIRMADTGGSDSNKNLQDSVVNALGTKFGIDNVAVVKTDFIGSSFSKTIAVQSLLLLVATIGLIWLYAAFRFHWDFSLGATIALIHDTLIMMTFIIWTHMEISTMTVAALLTIVGYSINATIVILDRVRSIIPLMETKKFSDIFNQALTDTLARSIITTVTTLFAVIALFLFTTGSIKDFSLALIVGLCSGCYSSIFISSGFIVMTRKNWKPEYGIHHSLRMQKGVINMDTGVQV
jgi:preprotein translocase subunit SecF